MCICVYHSHIRLPEFPETSVPFVCTTRTRRRCKDYVTSLRGPQPPHLFVRRLSRHLEMNSQMARLIPFPISSVGDVQHRLSKISHRNFRLNSKHPKIYNIFKYHEINFTYIKLYESHTKTEKWPSHLTGQLKQLSLIVLADRWITVLVNTLV